MANTIDAGNNNVLVAQAGLDAFMSGFAPIRAFAMDFSSGAANKGDTIQVSYAPAATAAITFAGSYAAQDSTLNKRTITLSGHRVVTWGVTDKEVANSSAVSIQRFGKQKGFQLAKSVFQDITAIITLANFGTAAFVGAASTFDLDDIGDIKEACDLADMPDEGRSLCLKSAYVNALIKDNTIQNASALGSASAIVDGVLPRIGGFDLFQSNLIPANGQNLVGFAAWPSAIAVAMRYLQPQGTATDGIYMPIVDEKSGIALGYREYYDNASGTRTAALECLFGFVLAEAAGIKRLTSA